MSNNAAKFEHTKRSTAIDTSWVADAVREKLKQYQQVDLPYDIQQLESQKPWDPGLPILQTIRTLLPKAEPILIKAAQQMIFGEKFHDIPSIVATATHPKIVYSRYLGSMMDTYEAFAALGEQEVAAQKLEGEAAETMRKAAKAFGFHYEYHYARDVRDKEIARLEQQRGAAAGY